jgi:hypothetical protein
VELAGSDPAEDATIGWAAYVHRATLWLGGDGTATADSLADLVGRRGRAKVDGQTVITAIAEEHEIAAARLSVAALLQAGGLCVAAEKETLAALTQCATHHEETPDVTLAALSGALALVDLCARPGQRLSLLNAYAAFIPSPNRLRRDVLPTREEIATHQETCEIRRRRTR